jgi:hypothetical protein
LDVLGHLCDSQGKARPATEGIVGSFEADAYLPQGVSEVGGPAVVEIVYLPNNDGHSAQRLAKKTQRAAALCLQFGVDNLLLVHNQTLRPQHISRIPELIQPFRPRLNVVFWDATRLQSTVSERPELIQQLFESLARSSVEERLTREPRGDQEVRREHLAHLNAVYQRDGVALFLGAGVSAGLGLPNWSTLIGALFASAFAERLDLDPFDAGVLSEAAASLNRDSPLQTVRYLRRALGSNSDKFEEQLSKVLYGAYNPSGSSELADAIARLCVPGRLGPKVHSVITYNFDDLLEDRLNNKHVDHSSIYHGNSQATAAELPVYHVHGFLAITDSTQTRTTGPI